MPSPLILDACLLITFGNVGRLSLITELRDRALLTTDRVRNEVLLPPASTALADAIRRGSIGTVAINLDVEQELTALATFDAMPGFRGRGEGEVLALAEVHGYVVGSDEIAVRRTAAMRFGAGRVATSLDILVYAMREGRLDLLEADALLDELDVGPGIRRTLTARGVTLAQLV